MEPKRKLPGWEIIPFTPGKDRLKGFPFKKRVCWEGLTFRTKASGGVERRKIQHKDTGLRETNKGR